MRRTSSQKPTNAKLKSSQGHQWTFMTILVSSPKIKTTIISKPSRQTKTTKCAPAKTWENTTFCCKTLCWTSKTRIWCRMDFWTKTPSTITNQHKACREFRKMLMIAITITYNWWLTTQTISKIKWWWTIPNLKWLRMENRVTMCLTSIEDIASEKTSTLGKCLSLTAITSQGRYWVHDNRGDKRRHSWALTAILYWLFRTSNKGRSARHHSKCLMLQLCRMTIILTW